MVDKTIEVGGIEFDAANLRDAVEAWDRHDNPAVYQDGIAVVDDGDNDDAFYLFHRDEGKTTAHEWKDLILEQVNEVTDPYDGLFLHAYDTDHWQVTIPLSAPHEVFETESGNTIVGYNPSDDVSNTDKHNGTSAGLNTTKWDGHMYVEELKVVDELDDI
jgi:hypothetical protein